MKHKHLGRLRDGVISAFLYASATFVLQGDQFQPVGGKETKQATELDHLPDLQKRKVGIRAELNYVRPNKYIHL